MASSARLCRCVLVLVAWFRCGRVRRVLTTIERDHGDSALISALRTTFRRVHRFTPLMIDCCPLRVVIAGVSGGVQVHDVVALQRRDVLASKCGVILSTGATQTRAAGSGAP